MARTIGYLRVSTAEQDVEKNKFDILKLAKGMKLGRLKGPGKSKLDANRVEIIALLNNGATKAYVARRYETSQPNLYNWLAKNNIKAA